MKYRFTLINIGFALVWVALWSPPMVILCLAAAAICALYGF